MRRSMHIPPLGKQLLPPNIRAERFQEIEPSSLWKKKGTLLTVVSLVAMLASSFFSSIPFSNQQTRPFFCASDPFCPSKTANPLRDWMRDVSFCPEEETYPFPDPISANSPEFSCEFLYDLKQLNDHFSITQELLHQEQKDPNSKEDQNEITHALNGIKILGWQLNQWKRREPPLFLIEGGTRNFPARFLLSSCMVLQQDLELISLLNTPLTTFIPNRYRLSENLSSRIRLVDSLSTKLNFAKRLKLIERSNRWDLNSRFLNEIQQLKSTYTTLKNRIKEVKTASTKSHFLETVGDPFPSTHISIGSSEYIHEVRRDLKELKSQLSIVKTTAKKIGNQIDQYFYADMRFAVFSNEVLEYHFNNLLDAVKIAQRRLENWKNQEPPLSFREKKDPLEMLSPNTYKKQLFSACNALSMQELGLVPPLPFLFFDRHSPSHILNARIDFINELVKKLNLAHLLKILVKSTNQDLFDRQQWTQFISYKLRNYRITCAERKHKIQELKARAAASKAP